MKTGTTGAGEPIPANEWQSDPVTPEKLDRLIRRIIYHYDQQRKDWIDGGKNFPSTEGAMLAGIEEDMKRG
jgi:hypothetical protein